MSPSPILLATRTGKSPRRLLQLLHEIPKTLGSIGQGLSHRFQLVALHIGAAMTHFWFQTKFLTLTARLPIVSISIFDKVNHKSDSVLQLSLKLMASETMDMECLALWPKNYWSTEPPFSHWLHLRWQFLLEVCAQWTRITTVLSTVFSPIVQES